MQVLRARQRNPSLQRNRAAAQATGDVLCFMDDDCIAPPGFFDAVRRHHERPDTVAVCGSNVAPPDDSRVIEGDTGTGRAERRRKRVLQAINASLTSRVAVFSKRAKLMGAGGARPASDEHVILCNFTIRRHVIEELGGLNTALYPNEERGAVPSD